MIRRPPRSTRKESSAASDVYKRQLYGVNGIRLNKLLEYLFISVKQLSKLLFGKALHHIRSHSFLVACEWPSNSNSQPPHFVLHSQLLVDRLQSVVSSMVAWRLPYALLAVDYLIFSYASL
eukprot:TRINITY_DN6258_c0_g1_i4.p1 TRINITY_DN6258_c0_g1~~TRINITY_DN6258_c0_g1_i4.p1  ORF type:complete len:128 (+),score=15.84 TRINITY_DN6258_c0_g1_i4:23-385(+)